MKVYLIGASGSGKTVVGKGASTRLACQHVDTDEDVLVTENSTTVSGIFNQHGEPYFRKIEKAVLERVATNSDSLVVSTGGGLPAIDGAMDIMLSSGLVIYLRATPMELWKRLEMEEDGLMIRPLLWKHGVSALEQLCEKRARYYERANIIVDTEGCSVTESVNQVVKAIRAHYGKTSSVKASRRSHSSKTR